MALLVCCSAPQVHSLTFGIEQHAQQHQGSTCAFLSHFFCWVSEPSLLCTPPWLHKMPLHAKTQITTLCSDHHKGEDEEAQHEGQAAVEQFCVQMLGWCCREKERKVGACKQTHQGSTCGLLFTGTLRSSVLWLQHLCLLSSWAQSNNGAHPLAAPNTGRSSQHQRHHHQKDQQQIMATSDTHTHKLAIFESWFGVLYCPAQQHISTTTPCFEVGQQWHAHSDEA